MLYSFSQDMKNIDDTRQLLSHNSVVRHIPKQKSRDKITVLHLLLSVRSWKKGLVLLYP